MDDQMTVEEYETPRVVDYGDLQELTAGCVGNTGGDAYTQANGGYATVSIPGYCSSKPSTP